MDEKKEPDINDQSRFTAINLEINMRAGRILLAIREERTSNWVAQEPTEWVMLIMTLLKGISRRIADYRELRKGFVEIAASCLIIINFADQVFDDHQQN